MKQKSIQTQDGFWDWFVARMEPYRNIDELYINDNTLLISMPKKPKGSPKSKSVSICRWESEGGHILPSSP